MGLGGSLPPAAWQLWGRESPARLDPMLGIQAMVTAVTW